MKALSAKLPLMGKISPSDLQVIAQGTEGFTGADLKALLYNAQLKQIDQQSKSVPQETSGACIVTFPLYGVSNLQSNLFAFFLKRKHWIVFAPKFLKKNKNKFD